jgi:hypothetical protein
LFSALFGAFYTFYPSFEFCLFLHCSLNFSKQLCKHYFEFSTSTSLWMVYTVLLFILFSSVSSFSFTLCIIFCIFHKTSISPRLVMLASYGRRISAIFPARNVNLPLKSLCFLRWLSLFFVASWSLGLHPVSTPKTRKVGARLSRCNWKGGSVGYVFQFLPSSFSLHLRKEENLYQMAMLTFRLNPLILGKQLFLVTYCTSTSVFSVV